MRMHNAAWSREECQESLDEVVLKIALSSLAEIEGKQLLAENERLKDDPRFQLSPEIDARIQRALRMSEMRKVLIVAGKNTGKIISKAAVVFLLIMVGVSSTFVVSAEFRRVIYKLLLSYEERYTQVERDTKNRAFIDSEVYAWDHTFAPTVLPPGYSVAHVEDSETIYTVRYENEEGFYLEFTQVSSDKNGFIRADSENAQSVQNIW